VEPCSLVRGGGGLEMAADVPLKKQAAGSSSQASLMETCRAEGNLGFLPACSLLWWFRIEKHLPLCSKLKLD